MRDWAVEQDAWEAEKRRARVATIGDVERVALEIATDNDDAAHRGIDALRADVEAMAERLLRAEAALVDAHRRLDVVAKRRAGDERDTRLLVERVDAMESRLAEVEEQVEEQRQNVAEVRQAVRDIARGRS